MLHLRIHSDCSGSPGPLPCGFDDAVQWLGMLPRMFIEWDGSFVWRDGGRLGYQWDGEVVDGGPQVQYIELKGAGREELAELLACLRLEPRHLLVELVRRGDLLSAEAFLESMDDLP